MTKEMNFNKLFDFSPETLERGERKPFNVLRRTQRICLIGSQSYIK